ncbi:MAG TPA: exodeoxyribonuclease VII small subunit [Phycisphaerae bacterium]|jgi:exodeoxyribonuclease VII small subunit
MGKKPLSFEEALKRLETLAEEIEQGKIGLEESIARYEEGMLLVKQCREILSAAELRIMQLQNPDQAAAGTEISRPAPTAAPPPADGEE